MQRTTLKPPHGWVGGKSKLSAQIVGLIPDDHDLYIEVFGGALNVLYAKELPDRARYREVANDYNGDLINLHRSIRTNPRQLQHYLNDLLISREIFADIISGRLTPRNDIERSAFYFYQLQMSFGSKGSHFAMTAKTRKPKNIYRDFSRWSQRLKRVTIENMDFEKLIREYDRPAAFFYCDPPYVGTESYYRNKREFGLEDHRRLSDALHALKGRFLLSYNDHPLVRELYGDFQIMHSHEIRYTLAGANSGKNVREIFVCNYPCQIDGQKA